MKVCSATTQILSSQAQPMGLFVAMRSLFDHRVETKIPPQEYEVPCRDGRRG